MGPGTSLPVQVGTEAGTVTLRSVLRLHLAGFQLESLRETAQTPCFLSLQLWAVSPDLGTYVPCISE